MIEKTIRTATHGRYLVRHGTADVVLVGFHGYGEYAEIHMERLQTLAGDDAWRLISIQALHRFYERRTDRVVASWMTRQDRELAIADNIAYVRGVLDEAVSDRHARSLFVHIGFSQGAAMAYRAAVHVAETARHVAAVGGDIPPELGASELAGLASVLLCRGRDDPWYQAERLDRDLQRLAEAGAQASSFVLPGAHAWSPEVTAAIRSHLDALVRGAQNVTA